MTQEERIMRGYVPWSKEGFQELNGFLTKLLKTPKDDWDLKSSGISISSLEPMGQVAKFLQKKYPEKFLWRAHLVRYNNIIRFLQEHKETLFKNNLLVLGKPVPLIKDGLMTKLSNITFNEERFTAEGKEYLISLDEVVS